LQKQASEFEKQVKNRLFNRKISPTCVGRKVQQNKKLARKLNKKGGEENTKKQAQNEQPFIKTRPKCLYH